MVRLLPWGTIDDYIARVLMGGGQILTVTSLDAQSSPELF